MIGVFCELNSVGSLERLNDLFLSREIKPRKTKIRRARTTTRFIEDDKDTIIIFYTLNNLPEKNLKKRIYFTNWV
jgi:hypothetical protein